MDHQFVQWDPAKDVHSCWLHKDIELRLEDVKLCLITSSYGMRSVVAVVGCASMTLHTIMYHYTHI